MSDMIKQATLFMLDSFSGPRIHQTLHSAAIPCGKAIRTHAQYYSMGNDALATLDIYCPHVIYSYCWVQITLNWYCLWTKCTTCNSLAQIYNSNQSSSKKSAIIHVNNSIETFNKVWMYLRKFYEWKVLSF